MAPRGEPLSDRRQDERFRRSAQAGDPDRRAGDERLDPSGNQGRGEISPPRHDDKTITATPIEGLGDSRPSECIGEPFTGRKENPGGDSHAGRRQGECGGLFVGGECDERAVGSGYTPSRCTGQGDAVGEDTVGLRRYDHRPISPGRRLRQTETLRSVRHADHRRPAVAESRGERHVHGAIEEQREFEIVGPKPIVEKRREHRASLDGEASRQATDLPEESCRLLRPQPTGTTPLVEHDPHGEVAL